jgi:hypothetical protein
MVPYLRQYSTKASLAAMMLSLWSKGAYVAEVEGLRVEGEEAWSSPGEDMMKMLKVGAA